MRYITHIPTGLHLPTRATSAIGNGYQGSLDKLLF